MNYSDFYLKNRLDNRRDILKFTSDQFSVTPDVTQISKKVSDYFGGKITASGSPVIKHNAWKTVKDEIAVIANELIPVAEKDYYGCNLRCDKIYIYRNVHTTKPISSWLYHYDNNPPTVLKLMIYLTDVDDDSYAPIETVPTLTYEPTRLGTEKWKSAPNNSRVPESEIDKNEVVRYYGKAGTTVLFYPNTVHRATVPGPGKYRDVLVIRVKPCVNDESDDYLRHADSFECSGACKQNPE